MACNCGDDFLIQGVGTSGGRHHALPVFEGHPQAAGEEIAQIIGQVGIDPGGQGGFAEMGVQPEDHLPEKEVADLVDAEAGGQGPGLHHVPQALGHLAGGHLPVAVDIEVRKRRHPHGLQHGGPIDGMGFEDILGDEVLGGPEFFVSLAAGVAQAREVVDAGRRTRRR